VTGVVLPNFLVIGAQKAGTSWLSHRLSQHPDVWLSNSEIHYFDKEYNFARGTEWYEEHFATVKDEKAIGEKTPDYLWANGIGVEGHLPDVHINIHRTLPHARLIVSLRNPVERAISAVNHIVRSGRISPLHRLDDLLVGDKQYLVQGHGVIDYGRYHSQLRAYLEYFDRSQLLVLIFEEDVIENPTAGLSKVCDFLDVDPSFDFRRIVEKSNEFRYSRARLILNYYLPVLSPITGILDRMLPTHKPRPTDHVVRELYRLYEAENQSLFAFLERDVPRRWRYREPRMALAASSKAE
jgi:hypothetical protein